MALIHTVQSIVDQRKTGRQTSVMRFPEDLGSHAIILNFKSYNYSQTDGGESRIGTDSIVLPLPTNLQDSFTVNAQSQELGFGGDIVAQSLSSGKTFGDLGAGFVDSLSGLKATDSEFNTKEMLTNFKAAAKFFGRSGLDTVLPGLGAAADVASGKAINPHVTIDFDGMNLKSHSFTWNFAPKNARESDLLRRITNKIRHNILPDYVGGSDASVLGKALLTYPDLVDIFFVGIDQSYFYHFKPCMVQSFTTNFSPNGLAFVTGGKPAMVQFQMSLTEAKIHTRSDYVDDSYTPAP
ncbi:MAG: hypothetical protein COA84_13100 [Robiginitomaculum sp.]|nr:MAG: hypothetical protein COA84_13100 [Robiginitomaculum sp.]